LTTDTLGLINKSRLGLMKEAALLVNCARGKIVQQDDLIDALKNGVIAGAAIDVFSVEPPPMDCPLLSMPNVLATPHMGSSTEESMQRMGLCAASEIHRVLSGESPEWPVNKPVGKEREKT
jgi:D-3-phosphoglycerate dehydrogenase